jgi:hypothetical protein
MLVIGILLIGFLTRIVSVGDLAPLFLVGMGIVFSLMAVLKTEAPASYEMSARTTLAYGLIALIIGVLWITVSAQVTAAGYVLAVLLIFFGLLFLAYTRVKPGSA